MQPLIAFAVSANVSYQPLLEAASARNIQLHCPISMASSTDYSPPLYQRHASERDSVTCSTFLRESYFAPSLAKVEVSMEGSDPLRSSPGYVSQHFKRHLHLRWFANDLSVSRLKKTMTISTRVLLMSKTYYGARQQGSSGYDNSPYRTKPWTKTIKLGARKCQFDLLEIKNTDVSSLSPQNVVLLLPIESNAVVPPTFTTLYAARRYTLRVVVNFVGYRHSTIVLEAPVQVDQCFEIRHLGTDSGRSDRFLTDDDAEVI
jgi:hypothetical protein